MAKHFWTILLAICYLVLFVALFFLFVSDNFYSYKNCGSFTYFSYIPFGMFVVCALAVYVLSAFMRLISARVSVAIVLGFAVAWVVVLSDANLFCGRGIHKSFMLSMWALSMVFLAGAPAMLAACALSCGVWKGEKIVGGLRACGGGIRIFLRNGNGGYGSVYSCGGWDCARSFVGCFSGARESGELKYVPSQNSPPKKLRGFCLFMKSLPITPLKSRSRQHRLFVNNVQCPCRLIAGASPRIKA